MGDQTRRQIAAGQLTLIGTDANGTAIVERDTTPRISIKTVWNRSRHNAGVYGSTLLSAFLTSRDTFSFPKSLYAVRDTLDILTHNKPNALILDVFAGSGTTLHATMLLNAQDGGHRRCILVTDNEVKDDLGRRLNHEGHFRGDPEFERHGIFEAVTRPRVMAAVTGLRPDATPMAGSYLDGREYADGFEDNIQFFRLNYLDPDEVDLGRQFSAIAPSLWLAAGGIGSWEEADPGIGFSLPPDSTYGVLFKESRFRQFKDALSARPDVTHVWLVTDSEEAYAEMRYSLSAELSVSMLYRDYLRNFRINTEQNL